MLGYVLLGQRVVALVDGGHGEDGSTEDGKGEDGRGLYSGLLVLP